MMLGQNIMIVTSLLCFSVLYVEQRYLLLELETSANQEFNQDLNEMGKENENDKCLNGGTWDPEEENCRCNEGSIGPKCGKLIFGHNQCLNGGTWDPEEEWCECEKGFIGPKCEKPIFGRNQCLNGGRWDPKKENCECNKGYMGPHCETLHIEEQKGFAFRKDTNGKGCTTKMEGFVVKQDTKCTKHEKQFTLPGLEGDQGAFAACELVNCNMIVNDKGEGKKFTVCHGEPVTATNGSCSWVKGIAKKGKMSDQCWWKGTTPFCDSDECENGSIQVDANEFGDGAKCWTGSKRKCCRQKKITSDQCWWKGTAPFCAPKKCDGGSTQVDANDRGDGPTKCWTGSKIKCCQPN